VSQKISRNAEHEVNPARPAALAVRVADIPDELGRRWRWVVWRYRWRGGRWTKVPFSPVTGKLANTTDQNTWGNLSKAIARLEKGAGDGIGFVFEASDGLVGIDFDDARDPHSGEIHLWAAELIRQLDSYSEVSPSGTGVKVWVRGALPGGRACQGACSTGKVEIYKHARFFAVTAHRLPNCPASVEERQGPLEDLVAMLRPSNVERPAGNNGPRTAPAPTSSDDELIARAKRARGGARFSRLWSGDCSQYCGDSSRADMALCAILANWTEKDANRIDRLFRRSGLMRPKWDERRGELTYGQLTIRKVLETTAAMSEPQPNEPNHTEQRTECGATPNSPVTPATASPAPDFTLPYTVEKNCVVHYRTTKGGDYSEPLCNFNARIIRQVIHDDGLSQMRQFDIEGRLSDGRALPTIQMTQSQFAAMGWPLECWGSDANVMAGNGKREHLRAAIQYFSRGAPVETVYTHLGWRQINGAWSYLHGAGAIGALGAVENVRVELDGGLGLFALPSPSQGDDLGTAVRASLRLLELAPDWVTFPAMGATYRAALHLPVDFGLWIEGRTGIFKTELAALHQQHFGAGMDARNLPGGWGSTANSLELMAHLAKNGLLVVDDFAPEGAAADVQRSYRKAARLIRASGNAAGRRRMAADGTLRPPRPPRALIMSTAEERPRGHSVNARL
jgi:hypothetical protein